MRIIFTARSRALLLLAVISLFAFQAQALAQDKAAKIDELMAQYHKNSQFNGTVLVVEGGKIIYKKGFGFANAEWEIPNTPDTRFRIGSITKQFTATLILQLVEQGKIKLDGKLTDYLTDYRKETGDRVTIHHLLNHTSGIPSYTGLPGFFQEVSRDPYSVADFVKKHASGDLEFEPGSKFVYNNSGYFLLGAIIEKVTGKPYDQVLKENILDPLGMKDTGYDRHDAIIKKRASGYQRNPKGVVNAPYLDMSLPYAAGSLYSTVEDLYIWDQALYTDKLISAKSKELMYKPGLQNYAYGWVVTKIPMGENNGAKTVIAHGGGINGFNTLITRLVDDKHLIVLFNNTGGARLDEMNRAITNILYDKPYAAPKKPISEALLKTIVEKDVAAAVKQYHELKTKEAAGYDFREPELNMLGYQLLEMKRTKDAIEIFKLNVEAYPRAANTYDSLGEAYMINGDKELAIQNYKKSLELNPNNANAAEALKKLGVSK
jgi:CubicO group peptidase (beta-lactamase class C family)